MKIASYNVNGVNGRLENLIRWLDEASPDIVCLQELKAPQTKFPIKAIEASGYGAVWLGQKSWNGVAILAKGNEPHLTRRRLPGDSKDDQSRYIEAIVDGTLIGCLYAPNGNPYPGPKFNYKLRWLKALRDYAAELLELNVSSILVGDYNVMPTELDVYKPERWKNDALFRIEVRNIFKALVEQGWTDALRYLHPEERISHFGIISGMLLAVTPGFASITFFLVLKLRLALSTRKSTSTCEGGTTAATMHRYGSN